VVDEEGKVVVPCDVFEGIEAVENSGLADMPDRARVAQIAAEMEFAEAAAWIAEHRGEYARGVFSGFAPADRATTPAEIRTGRVMIYTGTAHPEFSGCRVRIVRRLGRRRVEFGMWVEERRLVWATRDGEADDFVPLDEEKEEQP
jgi:hypothetical protein